MAFKLRFYFYIVTKDPFLQVKGCPEPTIENRVQGLLWGCLGTGSGRHRTVEMREVALTACEGSR